MARGKEELWKLLQEEMEQLPMPLSYTLDSYCDKQISEDAFICLCDVTTSVELDNQPAIHFVTRLTAGFRRVCGTYMAYHFHMSEASATQEEHEYFPLHYGVAEKNQLDQEAQMELLELMKESLPGGAMGGYLEPGFPLYFVNDELLDMLGYTYDEFIAQTNQQMINTIHPEDADMVIDTIKREVARQGKYTVNYRIHKKDGSYIWVHDIGRKIITPDGRTAVLSIVRDVSGELRKEADYQTQVRLMSHANEGSIGNYHLNLTRNLVVDEYGTNQIVLGEIKKSTTVDGFFENAQALMPNEEDRKRYGEVFNRESLSRHFHQGETTMSIEHRGIMDGRSVRWFRSMAIMTQNPVTEDVEAYLYAIDIHDEKIKQALIKKALSQTEELRVCIDTSRNAHIAFTNMSEDQAIYREQSEEMFTACAVDNYAGDDKEEFLKKFKIETILRELEDKEEYVFYYPIQQPEGRRYKRATYSYVDREFGLVSLLLTDITEIRRQQEEQGLRLEAALTEAKKANEAKTDFLSRMSHDIRTPMNAVIGLTALTLDEPGLSETVKENLNKMRLSSEYLLGLVNDILDMSKIEEGAVTLHYEPYFYTDFLTNIKTMFAPQCLQKGIHFEFEEVTTALSILTDKVRMNQIFFNIFSNAIKFTPEGGTVSYHTENLTYEDGVGSADYIISDTGIGMSKEFQQKMFEPFQQENNQVTANLQGTGLGLSIAKNLVNLLGGTMHIESELGVGTTVTVHLSFQIAQEEKTVQPEPGEVQGEETTLEGKHILLVEDHPLNAEIARKLLEKEGVQVTIAENGKIGLETFELSKPDSYDAILMDIRMPVMDGLAAARAIRALAREDAHRIPIIAMTANAYEEDKREAAAAGMNAHLAKPVAPKVMYDTLRELM